MQSLRDNQIYAKYNKCDFYKDQVQYLGHIISLEGTIIDPENIKTIMEWSIPKKCCKYLAFYGVDGYYHHFIEGFSRIAYLVTSLQKREKFLIGQPNANKALSN